MGTRVTRETRVVRWAELYCENCRQWYAKPHIRTVTTVGESKGSGINARRYVSEKHPKDVQAEMESLNLGAVVGEICRCKNCHHFQTYMLGPVRVAHALTFSMITLFIEFAALLPGTLWPLACILLFVSLGSACLTIWVLLRWDPNRKYPAIYDTANAPEATRSGTSKRTWAILVMGSVIWISSAWAIVDWHGHDHPYLLFGGSRTFACAWIGLGLVYLVFLSWGSDTEYPKDEQKRRWIGEARMAGDQDFAAASRHNFDWWQKWFAL